MASAGRFAGALAAVALIEVLLAEALPATADLLDLFVLLVVLNSLKRDSLRGLAGGLAAGLVQDTLSASLYGLNTLACCVVGYGVARLSQRMLTSQQAVAALLVAAGVLVHQVVVFSLLTILDVATIPPGAAILVRALVTAVVGLVWRWLIVRARAWWTKRRTLRQERVRYR